MNISQEEAQQSLADIEQIMRQTRQAITMSGTPYYLLIWGAIWFVGYLGSQFLTPAHSGRLWLIMDIVGIPSTFFIGWRYGLRLRTPLGPRLALLWLSILVYGGLILWLAQPATGNQLAALISMVVMLGYMVTGLWLKGRVLIWLGLTITFLTLFGYFALPAFFYLWMAVVGGGGLFVTGLYMLRRWR